MEIPETWDCGHSCRGWARLVNFSASYSDSESSRSREGRQEPAAGFSALALLVVSLINKT